MGSFSFGNCSNLTEVKCYAKEVPSTNQDAFENSYIEFCILYVPEESIDKYKAKKTWCDFKEIIPFSSTGIENVTREENVQLIITLDGLQHNELQKGINIIRMNNGKTKKVLKK